MMRHGKSSARATIVTLAVTVLAASAIGGCGSDKKDEPSKDPPPKEVRPPTPYTVNMGGTGASAPAGPNGRSAVPAQDEWNAAKEVGVKGSTKLNCETKMVREWLRVSCRGKNDTGGEPTAVTLKKGGGRGETFTFAANKVTSLVVPFVDGTDIVAEFEWTDKKQELVVSWPHGAPMPPMKGEFR